MVIILTCQMFFGNFLHALDRFFRRLTLLRGRAEANRLRFAPAVELYDHQRQYL